MDQPAWFLEIEKQMIDQKMKITKLDILTKKYINDCDKIINKNTKILQPCKNHT